MRYVQLRAFHYVAIHGGFSRAAKELSLTQPAISDQVRKLEAEYDILLFDRQRKQVVLTPTGEQLLAVTRRMFETEAQAFEMLSESRALRYGRLIIIADAVHHVLPVLAAFRERYPGVKLVLRSGNTDTIAKALMSYEADIGVIVPQSQETDISNPMRDTEVIHLNSSPVIAFVATGHELAGRLSVTFEELARYALIGREQGSKTRQRVEERAECQGVSLKFAIEAEGREAVREIVAAGLGVGFVSEAEFAHDQRLRRLSIEGAPIIMEETVLCLKERAQSKIIRAFFEVTRRLGSRPLLNS